MSKQVERLEPIISLPLPEDVLKEVVEKTKDWALMNGIAMRSKTNFSPDALQFAPFVLLPTSFPRKEFQKAVDIQAILNEMMHKVAHDRAFLSSTLKDTIQVDGFTGNLFKIYETVLNEGITQPLSLGLLRSDYLIHTAARNTIKQVEINTVASSFGGISSFFKAFNRFVLQELGHSDKIVNLPENNALSGLCEGMLEAWRIYNNPDSIILFIVENVTYNICDQRFHEFQIGKLNPQLKVVRRTLTQIAHQGSLGPEKELLVDDYHVGVVYFRAGYEPGHYPSQKEWDARLLIERSKAIKCPSIQYHLAGTKKVQQSLARYGAVERFLKDAQKIEAVKEIFTGLYSLDFDEFGEEAVKMALANPERFVLKPQREGGGNNVYGADVKEAIQKMRDSRERTAWILMERIQPPVISGYMIRPGSEDPPQLVDMVSELGIFGVIIGDPVNIISNHQVGHMLRTKIATANEGGVAAGLGALDSPYLID